MKSYTKSNKDEKFKNVAILGFGRFGQFLTNIFKRDFNIAVYDSKDKAIRRARRHGFVTMPLEKLCAWADVVYLAVPISSINQATKQLAKYIKPGTLIVDTCSVKTYPLKVMKKNLEAKAKLLGAHPLFGPDSARDSLKGHKIIVCPINISKKDYSFWKKYWEKKEVKIIRMTADEHDRQAAFSQGLTHFVGRVLDKLKLSDQKVTTKGYLNLLSLVEQTTHDSLQLFNELQRYNPYTKKMRNQLVKAFIQIRYKLDQIIRNASLKK